MSENTVCGLAPSVRLDLTLRLAVLALIALVASGVTAGLASAEQSAEQEVPPRAIGRDAALALSFPSLQFIPPEPAEYEVLGVPVVHLEDRSFPLVDVFIQIRGGITHFPRAQAPALSALSTLLRTGGTASLPSDSVDARLDLLAAQLAMGSGGGGSFAALNALTGTVDPALDLMADILIAPRFEASALEVWAGQERDRLRRRAEDPGTLAFGLFNHLLFGDHPVGWILSEADLEGEALSEGMLRTVHRQTHCRENLLIGVSGDWSWDEARPRIEALVARFPPCEAPLPEAPLPTLRAEGGVFVLPRPVEQSQIILGAPGGIRQGDTPDFFASRIANSILGGGGFTSRLVQRVRSEEGLAYSVASIWTSPVRYEGIVGALTATRPERTLEAVSLIVEILHEARATPPSEAEVQRAVDQSVLGSIFAFESAGQIVNRRMGDRAQGLPDDWFARYLDGIQGVTTEAVHDVVRRHLDPAKMTILVVGDWDRIGPGLEAFGPVHFLNLDGSVRADVEERSEANLAALRRNGIR
jgi:zinc protease